MAHTIGTWIGRAAAVAAMLGAGAGAAAEVRVAGSADPAALRVLETVQPASTVAIGPAPGQVAIAARDPEQEERSVVLLYAAGGSEPARVVLSGVVRALLFEPDGTGVFAIQYEPAKKRLGDAQLVRIDVAAGKARSVMRLPSSAAALDVWAARESLLVAGDNEIRTVRFAGLRSGPLFRVPGPNSAVACLAASDVVLLAQRDEVLLVNLSDAPGREGMPVRARAAAGATVAGLAADPDGTSALARLADGSVLRVTFDPLALEAAGSADAVVAAAGKSSRRDPVALPPAAPAAAAVAAAAAAEPAATPPVEAQPAPESAAAAAESGEPAVPAEPPPPAPVEAPGAPSAPPAASPDSPTPSTAPPAATSAAPSGTAATEPAPPPGEPQVWGAIEGPSRDAVIEVVLFGPDNLLREALRVRPVDGTWKADGLAPGRYQVQLAAGGNLVLVSEPRVVLVQIAPGGSVRADTFRVLRTQER